MLVASAGPPNGAEPGRVPAPHRQPRHAGPTSLGDQPFVVPRVVASVAALREPPPPAQGRGAYLAKEEDGAHAVTGPGDMVAGVKWRFLYPQYEFNTAHALALVRV